MKKIIAIFLTVLFLMGTVSMLVMAGPITPDTKGITCVDLLDFSADTSFLWARYNEEDGKWEQNEGPDDFGDVAVINGENWNQPVNGDKQIIAPCIRANNYLKDCSWSITDGGEVFHFEVTGSGNANPGVAFVLDELHDKNILIGTETGDTPRAEYIKIRVRNNSTATKMTFNAHTGNTGGGYKWVSHLLSDLKVDMNGKAYKSGTGEWETYVASMITLNTSTNYKDGLQKDADGNPITRWGGDLSELIIFPFGYDVTDGTGAYVGASMDIDYIVIGSLDYVTNYKSDLEAKEESITKLELMSEPTKKSYYIGDSVDLEGLQLKATYSDGTTETLSNASVVANLGSASDSTPVTLKFGSQSVSYNIKVVGISDIQVSKKPETLSYELAELKNGFTPSDFTYTVNYVDGTSKEVTSGVKYVGDFETVGTKTVTANYYGYTTTFDIDVITPVDLELTTPTKTYRYGDTLATGDFGIKLVFSDGTVKATADAKTSPTFEVVGDAKTPGEVTVSVTAVDETLGISLSKDVKINVEAPTEMKVTSNPLKTTYEVGEQFDPAGMVVSLAYANGKTVAMSDSDYRIRFDSSEPGEKEVRITSTIEGLDLKASINVTVEGTAVVNTTRPSGSESSGTPVTLIIIIVAAVVVIGGGVVAFVVIKKKKA